MDRPKVGLGVCIIKDGKILLGQRKGAHGAGSWAFPGGHLEYGESYEDCAQREVWEEAGITIKNIRFITATNDFFPQEQKHYITIYVRAELQAGDVVNKEPDKLVQWGWFSWDNLPQPLFLPLQNLLKQGFHPYKNVYQHYKGNFYEVVGEALHTETKEEVVLYRGLHHHTLFVRPKKMFYENVTIGSQTIPRFKRWQNL